MHMLVPIIAGSATAATGATAAAGTAAAGFSLAKVLAGGFSIASGLASIAQGKAEARSMEDQALWESFNERRELTRGREDAARALRAGNAAISAAQVAGFASGLRGSGSVLEAKLDAAEDTALNVGFARDDALIAAGARRGQAQRLRTDAKWARRGGWFNAFSTWGSSLGRFAQTG